MRPRRGRARERAGAGGFGSVGERSIAAVPDRADPSSDELLSSTLREDGFVPRPMNAYVDAKNAFNTGVGASTFLRKEPITPHLPERLLTKVSLGNLWEVIRFAEAMLDARTLPCRKMFAVATDNTAASRGIDHCPLAAFVLVLTSDACCLPTGSSFDGTSELARAGLVGEAKAPLEVRGRPHSPAGRRTWDSGAPSVTFGNSAKSAWR